MKGKKINTHLSIIPDLTRLHVAPSFIHIISDEEKKKKSEIVVHCYKHPIKAYSKIIV